MATRSKTAASAPDGTPAPSGTRHASSPPLILLDGMSLAFRAYFALPPDLATSAGVVTNAVHGFASMVVNLVRDHRPVGLAVAFDLPRDTLPGAPPAGDKGGGGAAARATPP